MRGCKPGSLRHWGRLQALQSSLWRSPTCCYPGTAPLTEWFRPSGPLGRAGKGLGIAASHAGSKDVAHIGPLVIIPALKVPSMILVGLLHPGRCALAGGEPARLDGVPPVCCFARCTLLRLQAQLLIVGLCKADTQMYSYKCLQNRDGSTTEQII